MDTQDHTPTTYLAYMLRLWQAGTHHGQTVWRASLENPHTGERLAFRDMKALFAFLNDLIDCLAVARTAPEAPGHAAGDCADPRQADEDRARWP